MAIKVVPSLVQVPPLTQTNAGGEIYRRREEVTEEIRQALGMHPSTWPALACADGKLMTNECLVHLIRHLHRQHETSILGSLSQILFDRCVGALRGYTRGFDQDTARDFYHDVYVELIDVLLDLAKPRADFLEVRFAMALRRRAIEVRMKYSTYWKRIALDADPAEILDASVVWIPDEDNAGTSEAMRRVTNNRLLKNIPEPQKSAFILHHMYGFTHKELAAPFKRSVSAIRNWLRRVDELLANDKE